MTRSLLLLLLLAPATLAAEEKPAPRLVEGRFGKALDALASPLGLHRRRPLPHDAAHRRVLGEAR